MESIKWFFYKLLVRALRQAKPATPIVNADKQSNSKPFYWIFCSTIGELNGCKPLISKYNEIGQLVLITDRNCYQDAFMKQFPDAIIVELQGWLGEAKTLITQFPPKQLILCEIPCLPYDAPCRLSYDFLRTLKQHHIPIHAVNGWLYEYGPSCRQDGIERKWFKANYLATFDMMMVQNQSVKDKLIAAGQQAERIHITGNMKFDAVANMHVEYKNEHAKKLTEYISEQDKLTLVAGSLSDKSEYEMIISAFCLFRAKNTNTFLVLAPRHPEKPEQITQIESILDANNLVHICRSDITDCFETDIDVLILDTFGELQGMYYACDFAYIGINHNVLEPLAFGKPVVIMAGWESTYPSYPVYELCKNAKLLFELSDATKLLDTFQKISNVNHAEFAKNTKIKLKNMKGALKENINLLDVK